MKTRSKVIGTRFYPQELELIRKLAYSRGLSVSEQVREAVMLFVLRAGSLGSRRPQESTLSDGID